MYLEEAKNSLDILLTEKKNGLMILSPALSNYGL